MCKGTFSTTPKRTLCREYTLKQLSKFVLLVPIWDNQAISILHSIISIRVHTTTFCKHSTQGLQTAVKRNTFLLFLIFLSILLYTLFFIGELHLFFNPFFLHYSVYIWTLLETSYTPGKRINFKYLPYIYTL